MSHNTRISWSDASWNPVSGCTEVSPGCAHCYAKTFAERWRGIEGHYYENGFDVQLRPNMLDRPLRWKKPRRIFVNSMSDLFHEAVPDDYIDKVFAVMALAPQHTFQLLTKRIERAWEYLRNTQTSYFNSLLGETRTLDEGDEPAWHRIQAQVDEWKGDGVVTIAAWPLPNVLIGPTIENQHFADVRLPYVAQLKAMGQRTMVSYEPALGPVYFASYMDPDCICGAPRSKHLVPYEEFTAYLLKLQDKPPTELGPCKFEDHCGCTGYRPAGLAVSAIDWLICGGESGPDRRPFNHNWAESAKLQAREAGVPFFMKQDGALRSEVYDSLPEDLKVREYPR